MSHLISTTRCRELVSIIRVDGNRIANLAATAELEGEMRAVEKDASHAGDVWPEYAGILNDKIDDLKRVPTQRKLTLTPSQQSSKSSAPGKSNQNCKPAAGGAKRSASKAKAGYCTKKAPAKKRAQARR